MSGFYDSMADMVRELLLPDTQGGLGQGAITIVRQTAGVPDPLRPYDPVMPSVITEDVDQIGNVDAQYRSGETVIGVDIAYMIVPPTLFMVDVGDVVRVNGEDVGEIVHVKRLGSNDVQVYAMIYCNR